MLEKYIIAKKENTDLNVYRCGIEECQPGYSWGPAVRDHYIIHYVLKGNGTFTLNGKAYAIDEDHGFLISPNQIVQYQASADHPWTYSWVGFHGLKADSILKKAGLTVENPTFCYQNDTLLKQVLNDMILAARSENRSELMLTGYLYLFLSLLVKNHKKNQPAPKGPESGDRYIGKAIDYIMKNYASRLTVAEIAKALQIDRSYLFMLFKEHVGLPPQQFIIQVKMEKAVEFLKNSGLSIGDVARSVGYDDPFQFSKTFKKTKGQSPINYRKGL